MSYALRAPFILGSAALITFGLFLAMRQLIWVEDARPPAPPDRPILEIDFTVPDLERPPVVRPEPVIPETPPPAPTTTLRSAASGPGERTAPPGALLPTVDGGTLQAGGEIQTIGFLQAVLRPQPVYPDDLARRGISGYCLVQFDVAPNGETANVRVLTCSHPGFARSSERAISNWRYRAALEEGRPVWSREQQVRLDFRFDEA